MVYGADLNARTTQGYLPIDWATTEEVAQAIRDEPRRRLDHGHKRATEQDRHPDAAASTSAQLDEAEEQDIKQAAGEGEIADEDQDSEPSSDEEDGK